MAKIRIIQPTFDKKTGENYEVGRILDLGGVRNKLAVESRQAAWVDSEKFDKAKENGEDVVNMSDKVEAPRGKKKRLQ